MNVSRLSRLIARKKQQSSRPYVNLIAIGDLRDIWTDNELRWLVPLLTNDDIDFALEHLLRTISLLVYIEASHASKIILDLIKCRTSFDATLHTVKIEKHLFNGSLSEKELELVDNARPLFTAPALTEGEDIELEGVQIMPLTKTIKERIGAGMSGVVVERMIPRGHLKSKDEVICPLTSC